MNKEIKDWLVKFKDKKNIIFTMINAESHKLAHIAAEEFRKIHMQHIDFSEKIKITAWSFKKSHRYIPLFVTRTKQIDHNDASDNNLSLDLVLVNQPSDHQNGNLDDCLKDVSLSSETASQAQACIHSGDVFNFETVVPENDVLTNESNHQDYEESSKDDKKRLQTKITEIQQNHGLLDTTDKSDTIEQKNDELTTRHDSHVAEILDTLKNDEKPGSSKSPVKEKSISVQIASMEKSIEKLNKKLSDKQKKENPDYLEGDRSINYPFFKSRGNKEIDFINVTEDSYIDEIFIKSLNEFNNKINNALVFPGSVLRLENVPYDLYRASKGLGSTDLKLFSKAPNLYIQRKRRGDQITRSKNIGSASHCKVLEPHLFSGLFGCIPPWLKTKNNAEYKAIAAHNPNTTFFHNKDYQTVFDISEAVINKYSEWLVGGCSEVSYWKKDPETELILKARIDKEIDHPDWGLSRIDLKTTKDSSPGKFEHSSDEYAYYLQDAHYSFVGDFETGLKFIVVETLFPHLPTFITYDEDDRIIASDYHRQILRNFKLCQQYNIWPGYTEQDEKTEIKLLKHTRQKIDNYGMEGVYDHG